MRAPRWQCDHAPARTASSRPPGSGEHSDLFGERPERQALSRARPGSDGSVFARAERDTGYHHLHAGRILRDPEHPLVEAADPGNGGALRVEEHDDFIALAERGRADDHTAIRA